MPSLKKRLGQHHLTRPEVCAPLVEFLRPEHRRVVEVGPGGGVLTGVLLDRATRVDAVELDPAWAFETHRRLTGRGGVPLGLAVADAMTLDWRSLARGTLVAGNLPYQIATALIRRLVRLHDVIPRMAFLVQKEVADRLAAAPGESAYGALALWTQAHARVRVLKSVKRGSFQPPPNVDSAFVGLTLCSPPLPDAQMAAFESTLHAAFGQRRKTLRNALAATVGRAAAFAWLEAADLDGSARAQELDLNAFVRLHQHRPLAS